MKRRILVSAILSVLLLAALAADTHAAEVKLTASDGATFNYFGYSVAISGDHAVVGAFEDDDAGRDSGSAYIYTIGTPVSEPFTTTDAAIALRIAVGSRPPDLRWDVSGDGRVTSLDALMILQAVAGVVEL
ncbi:MAG: FG-GAP repeat protein [Euryarchaeota archaeon]|nr:FG-GAP repeat protein [Euryarchaeota archaeon]